MVGNWPVKDDDGAPCWLCNVRARDFHIIHLHRTFYLFLFRVGLFLPSSTAEINTADLRRTPVSCLVTFALLTVALLAELHIVAPQRPEHAEPITAGFCFASNNNTDFALLLLVLPANPRPQHMLIKPAGSAHSASLCARVNCLVCIYLSPIFLFLLLFLLLLPVPVSLLCFPSLLQSDTQVSQNMSVSWKHTRTAASLLNRVIYFSSGTRHLVCA